MGSNSLKNVEFYAKPPAFTAEKNSSLSDDAILKKRIHQVFIKT